MLTVRVPLLSHAGFSLEGMAVGVRLGWAPAGQLCGTAAIVEKNSFLITHLSSQFNRKYSSWDFFFVNYEGNQEAYLFLICRICSWKLLYMK